MKKSLLASVALAFALGISSAAFAGNEGDGSGWGTQPGYDVAIGNSQVCAGGIAADHGSFGAFGKGYNLGIEFSPGNGNTQHATIGSWPGPGTDGTQTGINNSGVCGDPNDVLPN